jgi:serine protease Do
LKPKDIVIAINGQPLQKHLQLGNKVASMRPGDKITLTIQRNGEKKKISVTLGSANQEGTTAGGEEDTPSKDQLMKELGLNIQNVTPEIARQLGLDEDQGVVITDVDRSNPMIRQSGLAPKQVIIEMAGKSIPDVETFQEVYAKIPAGEAFRVAVRLPQGFVDVTSLRKPE